MKSRLVILLLLLIFNFSFLASVFSKDIKFQRVLNIGIWNNCPKTNTEDNNSNIWLGSYKGELYLYTKDGKIENFKPVANDPFSLPSNSIYSILDDSKGKVWLGIYGGFVSLFNDKTFTDEWDMKASSINNV